MKTMTLAAALLLALTTTAHAGLLDAVTETASAIDGASDSNISTGKAALVPSMAMAAVAAGADGVMIEVHNDPASALCDGNQSLRPETFDALAKNMLAVHSLIRQQQAVI